MGSKFSAIHSGAGTSNGGGSPTCPQSPGKSQGRVSLNSDSLWSLVPQRSSSFTESNHVIDHASAESGHNDVPRSRLQPLYLRPPPCVERETRFGIFQVTRDLSSSHTSRQLAGIRGECALANQSPQGADESEFDRSTTWKPERKAF